MCVKEKEVKQRVNKILKLYGSVSYIYIVHPMTFGYGAAGHPDTLALVNGRLLAVEVKRNGNNHHSRPELKPSSSEAAQVLRRREIEAAGGHWVCIHSGNVYELAAILDYLISLPDALAGRDAMSWAERAPRPADIADEVNHLITCGF